MTLRITRERLIQEMFTGGFRPMNDNDWAMFCDADEGSLMSEIRCGNHHYMCVFSPATGEIEAYLANSGESWMVVLEPTWQVVKL